MKLFYLLSACIVSSGCFLDSYASDGKRTPLSTLSQNTFELRTIHRLDLSPKAQAEVSHSLVTRIIDEWNKITHNVYSEYADLDTAINKVKIWLSELNRAERSHDAIKNLYAQRDRLLRTLTLDDARFGLLTKGWDQRTTCPATAGVPLSSRSHESFFKDDGGPSIVVNLFPTPSVPAKESSGVPPASETKKIHVRRASTGSAPLETSPLRSASLETVTPKRKAPKREFVDHSVKQTQNSKKIARSNEATWLARSNQVLLGSVTILTACVLFIKSRGARVPARPEAIT